MRNNLIALGMILAGLVAKTGFTGSPGTPAPAARSAEKGVKAPEKSSKRVKGKVPLDKAATAIYEYYDSLLLGGAERTVNSGPFSCEQLPSLKEFQRRGAPDIDAGFLLAFVPDPIRSDLDLDFNRTMDALIAAVEESGYSYDRYWFPWQHEGDGAEKGANGGSSEGEKNKDAEARQDQPGLLLFRDSERPLRTLAVFLIGELPTSGVNRRQFHEALCLMRSLKPESADKLRILGPHFSGSVTSLKLAVSELAGLTGSGKRFEKNPASNAEIISPSISSPAIAKDYRVELETAEGQSGPGIKIRSAVLDDGCILDLALSDLRPEMVAIISESGTSYGGGASKGIEGGRQCGDRPPGLRRIDLRYPREIANLRNAYQEHVGAGEGSKGGQALPMSSRQLPFLLKNSQSGRDILPRFDPQNEAIYQETVLWRLAAALRQNRVELAVLQGTNYLDVLFLARFFREAAPDTRLLLTSWSTLFTHGRDTQHYTGIYFASSDAPFDNVSPDTPEDHEDLMVFPTQGARGVYMAIRNLLGGVKGKKAPKLPERREAWLSVVGRDTFWPVRHLGERSVANAPGSKPAGLPEPGSVAKCLAALAALGVGVIAVFAILANRPTVCGRLPAFAEDLCPVREEVLDVSRAMWLAVMFGFLLAAWVAWEGGWIWVLLNWGMYLAAQSSFFWPVLGALLMASAAAAVWALGENLWRLLRHQETRTTAKVALTAAVVLLACSPLVMFTGDPETVQFAATRSIHLSSGVGPAVPLALLLAACAWGAWVQVRRAALARDRWPGIPRIFRLNIEESATPDDLFGRPFLFQAPSALPAIGVGIVVAAATILFRRFLNGIDGPPFDWCASILLAAVTVVSLAMAFALWHGWTRFHRILVAVRYHPVLACLKPLPEAPFWQQMWQPSVQTRHYTIGAHSIELLTRVQSFSPGYIPDFGRKLAELDQVARKISAVEKGTAAPGVAGGGKVSLATRYHDVSNMLRRITEEVATGLEGRLTPAQTGPAAFDPQWVRRLRYADAAAMEYLAVRLTAYIRYVLLHLRNLLASLTAAFLLTVVALNSYPFRSANFIRGWIGAAFVLLGVAIYKVLSGMERDAVLSRLADSPADKLEPMFYVRMLSAIALPLLAVLGSLVPGVGEFLFSWIHPAIEAMK